MALVVKNPPANAGAKGSVPVLGRSCPEGNGNPFQYSCLENTMDRGAWRPTVLGGHKQSDMTEHPDIVKLPVLEFSLWKAFGSLIQSPDGGLFIFSPS